MATPPAPPGALRKSTLNSASKNSPNLTPCRRLGLGRPSTSSLKKSLHLRVINSSSQNETECLPSIPSEESAVRNCVKNVSVSVDNTNVSNAIGARRRLKISSKTPSPNHVSLKRVSDSDIITNYSTVVQESQLSERLNSKRRRFSLKNISVTSDNVCDFVSEETLNKAELIGSIPKTCSVGNENQTPTDDQTPTDVTPEIITQLIATILDKKKRLEQLKVQDIYAKKHNLKELREQTGKWKTAGQEALRYAVDLAKQAGFSITLSQLMTQHGFPRQLMGYDSDEDEFN